MNAFALSYEDLSRSNAFLWEEWEGVFRQMLQKGQFVLGEAVADFEQAFARYCGAKWAIGVNSGLDALTLALQALNLPAKSEVLVPAHTFIATVFSVLQAGLKPVLVEPEADTMLVSGRTLEAAQTPQTRAIVIVHLYGQMPEMPKIMDLARQKGWWVLEDAAQAHGASYLGQRAGSWGDLAAFSFYPTKNLGALGDGGSITTQNADWAEKLQKARNYGSQVKYYHDEPGLNSRLDALQAAFLSVKLPYLDQINAHKRHLAQLYHTHLREDFICPAVLPHSQPVYHIFSIRHPAREALREYLLRQGIQTALHYPLPVFRQKALAGRWNPAHYPLTAQICQTQLSLPIAYFHTEDDILRVIEIMNRF
ncbi:MAG: DegT/DnrJ/EryC1/StrS family aminotransferase [Microscillaceae bacterium]